MTLMGRTSPLRGEDGNGRILLGARVPTRVFLLSPKPALGLGGGNRSSCPKPALPLEQEQPLLSRSCLRTARGRGPPPETSRNSPALLRREMGRLRGWDWKDDCRSRGFQFRA